MYYSSKDYKGIPIITKSSVKLKAENNKKNKGEVESVGVQSIEAERWSLFGVYVRLATAIKQLARCSLLCSK